MKNQKICIIGDGLTGLTAALVLKNLNLNIDLYMPKKKSTKIDKRITAVSESNYQFLKNFLHPFDKKIFWSCKEINLFSEKRNDVLNFLNFKEKNCSLMHIFENGKYKKNLHKQIKNKNIKLINKIVTGVGYKEGYIKFNKSKTSYDLIILCLGSKSKLYDEVTGNKSIQKNYNEVAITGYVSHKIKHINPSQYFLKEGPLALLPFNKNKFSFVWSLKKDFYSSNKNNLKIIVKHKLNKLLKKENKITLSKIQSFQIQLDLKTKYFKNNVLILGEGLHSIHPMAGQGFNLVIRDISKLSQIIKKCLNLGMSLKNSFILKEFYETRKPENIFFGLGIDFTNIFFRQHKYLDPFKNIILKNISKFYYVKKISKIVSDRGINI